MISEPSIAIARPSTARSPPANFLGANTGEQDSGKQVNIVAERGLLLTTAQIPAGSLPPPAPPFLSTRASLPAGSISSPTSRARSHHRTEHEPLRRPLPALQLCPRGRNAQSRGVGSQYGRRSRSRVRARDCSPPPREVTLSLGVSQCLTAGGIVHPRLAEIFPGPTSTDCPLSQKLRARSSLRVFA